MKRVVLVHWNTAEAEERAAPLREGGYEVSCYTDPRGNPRGLRDDPPDAFVIDLARMPSQGREIGAWLRRQVATRRVPLVFVEGDPEKTARVRALLPDATFTAWGNVRASVAEALVRPPAEPVVPGTMDAYAGVSIAVKLGIADGRTIALLNAPAGFTKTLGDLPEGAILCLKEGGRLWLAWPKRASGAKSDLSQTVVRAYGLERGFVDYKVASIDATWSALCFARRA